MKKLFFLAAIAATGLSFEACNNNPSSSGSTTESTNERQADNNVSQNTSSEMDDPKFAENAASGGMMEVALGKFAQANAVNQSVKKFGAMMVEDHSKANSELMAIARDMNVTLPTAMMPMHEQMVNELKTKKGADFDKAYMEMMVNDHNKDIALFANVAKLSSNENLKDFAAKTLPILKNHLSAAKTTQNELK